MHFVTGGTCHGGGSRTTQFKNYSRKRKISLSNKEMSEKEGLIVYKNFTEEQRAKARQTDLAKFLVGQGEKVSKAGSEYEWLDGWQKVSIKGNLWLHQYERVGGDSVDFVQKFYGKSYPEAVEFLLSGGSEIVSSFSAVQACKPFVLPKANDNMRRTFAYLLLTRGIDRDVVYEFVRRRMIYESADYHNAVFVGYDLSGTPCHAHKHGTVSNNSYKGNVAASQPEYSFHWHGQSDKIFLFEAPIDMLSFISMHKENWQQHSYAAACSVSDRVLFRCLEDNPYIKNVYLCFDNDSTGQTANRRIAEKLEQMNIKNEILVPENKDWNEDILLRNGGEILCSMEFSR